MMCEALVMHTNPYVCFHVISRYSYVVSICRYGGWSGHINFLSIFSYHLRKVDSSEVPPFASKGLDLYSISARGLCKDDGGLAP